MASRLNLTCAMIAMLGGAGMLWREVTKQQQQQQQQNQAELKVKKKRQKQAAAGSAADISAYELSALQTLICRVHKWRGWQCGLYHIRQAWHEVETAAATADGGSWLADFDGLQLSSENCNRLLHILDNVFFAGKLMRRLRSRARGQHAQSSSEIAGASSKAANGSRDMTGREQSAGPALQCQIVQAYRPQDTWLCYFDPDDNVVYINRWRWGKHITPEQPVNCEGVICTSRLQMLLHTLAHELVHAIVFHLFPEIDRSSPAYLPNDRHGPVFLLLNKQLFGHSSIALEHV